ncbi:response regulator transcription factor [Faecalibaculum rodentium]|nr:response regulator transcription factor [Faecalibaculum rodentium]
MKIKNKTFRMPSILIVEDDWSLAQAMKEFLSDYDVLCVQTMEQAVREWKQVDLFLLDVRLPDGDGIELAAWLRTVTGKPILMISGCGKESDQLDGYEAGADDYIVKPVSGAILLAKVRALINRTGIQKNLVTWKRCVADLDTCQLRNGQKVAELSRSETEIVALLLQAQGNPVSSAVIRSRLSRELTESSLSSRISELRRKLKETGIQVEGRASRGYSVVIS